MERSLFGSFCNMNCKPAEIAEIWKKILFFAPRKRTSSVSPQRKQISKIIPFPTSQEATFLLKKRPEAHFPFHRTTLTPMNEIARQIIREQWALRNNSNPVIRQQARSLIKTHIFLLRGWRVERVA